MNPESRLIFRIIGILSFLSVAATLWRLIYYLSNPTLNVIVWKIIKFLGILTLISYVCLVLDVYIFPEWGDVFSIIFRNVVMYWLVVYFYKLGTQAKTNELKEVRGKLSKRVANLITELEDSIK